jgi:hypothetical protein
MTCKRAFLFFLLMVVCTTQSGCALLQLPFQALGTAAGAATAAAKTGIAVAPHAAPFFL